MDRDRLEVSPSEFSLEVTTSNSRDPSGKWTCSQGVSEAPEIIRRTVIMFSHDQTDPLTYQPDYSRVGRGEEKEFPAEVDVLHLGLALLLQQDVGAAHDGGGAEAGAAAAAGAAQL